MSSFFTNFAALSNQSRDLLTPVEYRTIMEMLNGILGSKEFDQFDRLIKSFETHLASRDPLFLESGVNFKDKFIESVYLIYTHMLPNPADLLTFKSEIVASIQFSELLRRIVLNRHLYGLLKQTDGRIPAGTYTVPVVSEWYISQSHPHTVDLTIASTLVDEYAFIEYGWNGSNTAPYPLIQTAVDLSLGYSRLPVIFAYSKDIAVDTTVDLESVNNDLTIRFHVNNYPTNETDLFTITNGHDVLSVSMDSTGLLFLTVNGSVLLQTDSPSTDGRASLIIDSTGDFTFQITNSVFQFRTKCSYVLRRQRPFVTFSFLQTTNVTSPTLFSVNSIVVHKGFEALVPPDDIVIPLGYTLLIDDNGAYMCDPDGVPLMDVDIEIGADERGNFDYLIDADGSFLMDGDGAYYIVPSDNYFAIIDDDGAYLLDDDGKYIIEAT